MDKAIVKENGRDPRLGLIQAPPLSSRIKDPDARYRLTIQTRCWQCLGLLMREVLYKLYVMRTPLVLGGISTLVTPCADSVGEQTLSFKSWSGLKTWDGPHISSKSLHMHIVDREHERPLAAELLWSIPNPHLFLHGRKCYSEIHSPDCIYYYHSMSCYYSYYCYYCCL